MHSLATLLIEVGALLLLLGLLSRLAIRVGISPIPLYLVLGLVVGSSGLLSDSESSEFIAIGSELGVILLLVMLGIEYSASELVTNLKQSRAAGLLDLVANGAPGFAMGLLLGWSPIAAFALAGVISLITQKQAMVTYIQKKLIIVLTKLLSLLRNQI
jgi:CPA2 family monovalent cation:H+ antiporter-2